MPLCQSQEYTSAFEAIPLGVILPVNSLRPLQKPLFFQLISSLTVHQNKELFFCSVKCNRRSRTFPLIPFLCLLHLHDKGRLVNILSSLIFFLILKANRLKDSAELLHTNSFYENEQSVLHLKQTESKSLDLCMVFTRYDITPHTVCTL